jgi:tetratricopeptide (TPR) repeat protein
MKLFPNQLGTMTIIVGILMPIPVLSHSLKGSIADFDRVIKINPNDALAYSNRGTAKLALGDNNGAIADFDRAIKINPNYANAYLERGNIKLSLGAKQGTIADWSKAAELLSQQGEMDYYQKVVEMIVQLKER